LPHETTRPAVSLIARGFLTKRTITYTGKKTCCTCPRPKSMYNP
jgi:hypothetical protein